MNNQQVRLLASAIAMIAGALAASTYNLNVNVGITIILVSSVLFLVEYVRSQR
jgi:ABC-type Mn2+/Zn2+ transport system permease subunit